MATAQQISNLLTGHRCFAVEEFVDRLGYFKDKGHYRCFELCHCYRLCFYGLQLIPSSSHLKLATRGNFANQGQCIGQATLAREDVSVSTTSFNTGLRWAFDQSFLNQAIDGSHQVVVTHTYHLCNFTAGQLTLVTFFHTYSFTS
ncbi:hypothetical protein D3C75_855470 [compost metagenome]